MNPPVETEDLDLLRASVAPWPLPDDIVALLRWADGTSLDRMWWPSLNRGPLLSARLMASEYRTRRDTEAIDFVPMFVPITRGSWWATAVELVTERPGVVVDISGGDPGFGVASPHLAAALHATADIAEANLLQTGPPEWPRLADWEDDCRSVANACYERIGWANWPYEREFDLDPTTWPPHWRRALIGQPDDP